MFESILPLLVLIAASASHPLPSATAPHSYVIDLAFGDFDRGDLYFTGSVLIAINVSESTNNITLHCAVLVSTTLLTHNGDNRIAHTHDIDHEHETLIIRTTEETLQQNSLVTLRVEFTGAISIEKQEGVFRRSHLDSDGRERYYVVTRTRPSFARRIFPLYDEPSFRATFQITLTHGARYRVLSNMREMSVVDTNSGRRVSTFGTTRRLSPHLVAFIISEFDTIANATTADGVALRIFAASSQRAESAELALEITQRTLEILASEFSSPYGFDKLDQVALPHFDECVVVGHGLTFFRENCLLHEPLVCHQLIDDKITSWSGDTIAGGLCRFLEYRILEEIYPASQADGLFTVEVMESALLADSVQHSEEIAYNKTASVFRMLQRSLSEATFAEGLRIYLAQPGSLDPSGVTAQRALYDAFQQAVDNSSVIYNVEELFGGWEQQGHPVLHVERSYNDHRVRFTQQSVIKNDNSLWRIPVIYGDLWLPPVRELETAIEELRPDTHLLVNADRGGFYRVHYDDANWMLIARELSAIDATSRAMVMNDAASFLAAGSLNAQIFLELTRSLENDVEYLPWLVATNSLRHMRWIVVDGSSKLSDDFKRFVRRLSSRIFITFGIEPRPDEEDYAKHIRNIAIAWSCGVHSQSCLDATREKLWSFLLSAESESLPVDHETVIFCHGLIMATEHEFDLVWRMFRQTASKTRRSLFLDAMGCVEDERVLMKFIATIVESDELDAEEIAAIVKATYGHNHVGVKVALQFLRSHYDAVIGLLHTRRLETEMREILHDIASKVSDEVTLATLSDILIIYDIDAGAQDEILAIASGNLRWLVRHTSDIEAFLNDFHSEASMSTLSIAHLLIIFPLLMLLF